MRYDNNMNIIKIDVYRLLLNMELDKWSKINSIELITYIDRIINIKWIIIYMWFIYK